MKISTIAIPDIADCDDVTMLLYTYYIERVIFFKWASRFFIVTSSRFCSKSIPH